jgi:hypothetical protein
VPFIGVVGEQEFRRLAAQLRGKENRAVRLRVGKAIRAEAKPVVVAVKRAVMATPSRGGSRGSASRHARAAHNQARSRVGAYRLRGLRASVAAGVGVETNLAGRRPSVRIVVRRSGLPPDQRRLPSRLNNPGGWRHPVFGNREIWVHQDGHPYFDVTIRRHEKQIRRAVIRAVEQGAQDIARGV